MLDVRDVTVRFDGRTVLDRVSLHLQRGEIVALLGPSGSGKSTLLRTIAGLLAPDSGSVWLDGVDVTAMPTHERRIGLVFQDEQLFPHLSVAANVGFGLQMQRIPRAARTERVRTMLDLVGLTGFDERRVDRLSGGEAKRVALARSLAPEPRVLLLDEPLTGLDRDLHDRLADELARMLRATGTTALLVTHDRDEAHAIADRVVSLTHDIVELAAHETHPLRLSVLRANTPTKQVVFPEDDLPGTRHLGLRVDGRLVAVSSWVPHGDSVQLRGMATDHTLQSTGLGGELLEAGCAAMADAGFDRAWANARDAALAFYLRHRFEVEGDGFIEPHTQLPHHVVTRSLRR